jgi:predicted ATPase
LVTITGSGGVGKTRAALQIGGRSPIRRRRCRR